MVGITQQYYLNIMFFCNLLNNANYRTGIRIYQYFHILPQCYLLLTRTSLINHFYIIIMILQIPVNNVLLQKDLKSFDPRSICYCLFFYRHFYFLCFLSNLNGNGRLSSFLSRDHTLFGYGSYLFICSFIRCFILRCDRCNNW